MEIEDRIKLRKGAYVRASVRVENVREFIKRLHADD
jgi:hypothetical protein